MRPASKKRAVALRLYAKRRRAFLEANPVCHRCHERATDVHHMQGRVGGLLLDESKWLPLCRDCHREVTVRPRWAIEQGYSLPRVGRAS